MFAKGQPGIFRSLRDVALQIELRGKASSRKHLLCLSPFSFIDRSSRRQDLVPLRRVNKKDAVLVSENQIARSDFELTDADRPKRLFVPRIEARRSRR